MDISDTVALTVMLILFVRALVRGETFYVWVFAVLLVAKVLFEVLT
jgi:hypothetical protein